MHFLMHPIRKGFMLAPECPIHSLDAPQNARPLVSCGFGQTAIRCCHAGGSTVTRGRVLSYCRTTASLPFPLVRCGFSTPPSEFVTQGSVLPGGGDTVLLHPCSPLGPLHPIRTGVMSAPECTRHSIDAPQNQDARTASLLFPWSAAKRSHNVEKVGPTPRAVRGLPRLLRPALL